jgi:pSer/pThr/pTyr-binding forkhead associated (FHA) protein
MDNQNPHRREGQDESTMFVAPMVEARLVNEANGNVYPVTGNVTTIGRGETNKIVIPERSISRTHCRVERTSTGYRMVDMNSTNGTFVNGHKVTRTTIHNGDNVRLGAVSFRFEE